MLGYIETFRLLSKTELRFDKGYIHFELTPEADENAINDFFTELGYEVEYHAGMSNGETMFHIYEIVKTY